MEFVSIFRLIFSFKNQSTFRSHTTIDDDSNFSSTVMYCIGLRFVIYFRNHREDVRSAFELFPPGNMGFSVALEADKLLRCSGRSGEVLILRTRFRMVIQR